jgi:hypothetical protein
MSAPEGSAAEARQRVAIMPMAVSAAVCRILPKI